MRKIEMAKLMIFKNTSTIIMPTYKAFEGWDG